MELTLMSMTVADRRTAAPGGRLQFLSRNGNNRNTTTTTTRLRQVTATLGTHKLVHQFNPQIPVEKALTPPSSWYTDPSFYDLEFRRVFCRGWQAVGYTEQIQNGGDFFTGRLGNVEFVVCMDDDGELQAFHNVCRHRASLLASGGAGKMSCFVCPYHGWTYSLDGALVKATRTTGIQNFNTNEFGLIPINVTTWGPFVLLNLDQQRKKKINVDLLEAEWLGSSAEILKKNGLDSSLSFVCRRIYTMECNWKVFCDNFIDGGYHVPYAHKSLASDLQLTTYSTTVYEKVSIQSCEVSSTRSGDDDGVARLGSKAFYAFIYPNFTANRYGPWMETNLVLPLGPRKCQVVFDYILAPHLKDDKEFIESSLAESEALQMEDMDLCESVQKGLESPAYESGRYVPAVEKAVHHFHSLLHHDLVN